MGRIQANTGLVTGIDIQGTVDKLIALQAQPRDRLAARLKDVKAKQTAVADLSASVIGVQLATKSLASDATFTKRSVTISDPAIVTATVSADKTPSAGSVQFTPVRLVSSQQLLGQGFASADATPGAGSLTIRQGGQLDRSVALSRLNSGQGVERGKIRITDRSGTSAVVDLRFANTIDDVLAAINESDDIDVTAIADGDRIKLIDNTGESVSNLRVREVGTTTTAGDLGLAGINVASANATGADILSLYAGQSLTSLNDGQGLSINESLADLRITFRDTSSPLDIDFFAKARAAAKATGTSNAASGINGDITLTADTAGATYDGVQLVFVDSGNVTQGSETVSYNSGSKTLTIDIDAGSTTADDVIQAINNDATAAPLFTATRGAGADGTGLIGLTDTATLAGGAAITARTETSLQDLLDTINAADPARLRAALSADGDRIELSDLTSSQGGTFTVSDLNNGTLAADLGLGGTAVGGTLTGGRLSGGLQSPLVRSLNGGRGFDLGTLSLTDRTGASASLDLSSAVTLDDILNGINNSGLALEAELNAVRSGIVIRDTSGSTASNLIVADGDAKNTATQLGITLNAAVDEIDSGSLNLQTISESTLLADIGSGSGITSGSFTISDSAGNTGAINITTLGAKTLGDVITAINDLSIGVDARINDTGDGLLLTDTAGGAGKLKVVDSGSGTAAAKLKIAGTATGTTLDGSQAVTISLADDDTLKDLVEKINDADTGLQAALIDDGSDSLPVRVALTSTIAGSRGNFSIDDGGAGIGLEEVVRGEDALLSLAGSGTLLTSSSNTFDNAVDGLDITILAPSTQSQTITVKTDVDSISSRVKAFVDQYNKLRDKLETYDFYNTSDGSKGVLFGTTEALRISSDLSRVINKRYFASSEIQYITALGVNFTEDGHLSFDSARFSEQYAKNPDAVEKFFTETEKGFAKAIDNVAESLAGIDDSALISSSAALQKKAEQYQLRIDFLSARLNRSEERLLKQFYDLETTISKLQNTFGSIQSSLTNAINLNSSQGR